jgi:predicted Fe-S protein YdhL (DUF1289 family)
MSLFPKIQRPCPYKSQLAAIMDGDVCRMCHRQVFELTHMSDDERVSFLQGCSEEVCVSYSVALRPAVAAAVAAAAMGLPTAAAAQDAAEVNLDVEEMVIFVGGIKDPADVEMVEVPSDNDVPELPVTYEDAPEQPASPAAKRGAGGSDARS